VGLTGENLLGNAEDGTTKEATSNLFVESALMRRRKFVIPFPDPTTPTLPSVVDAKILGFAYIMHMKKTQARYETFPQTHLLKFKPCLP
jgi:hypothetical protein